MLHRAHISSVALVLTLAACGGGSDGQASLVGFSDAPASGGVRAALSPDGSSLVYAWDSTLSIAAVGEPADGEPAPEHSSLYDDGDVDWYAGEPLPLLPDGRINTVQFVDADTLAITTIERRNVVQLFDRDGTPLSTREIPEDGTDPVVVAATDEVFWVDSGSTGTTIGRAPLAGDGATTVLTLPAGWFGGFDVSADGSRVAYTWGETVDDSRVFVVGVDGSDSTDLADSMWAPRFVGDDILFIEPAGTADDGLPLQKVSMVSVDGGTVTRHTDDELQKNAVIGRLPDGRLLYRIQSYGYQEVLGITTTPE